ncbi:hypothetical protein ACE1ET_17270 [Saccharicrinis sp. FJH62]|uniref:hypothetical protein n=1 Tax=Saccharicrinis sp. FJH62 TaxID=3344657 RepID=UPI0035D408DB
MKKPEIILLLYFLTLCSSFVVAQRDIINENNTRIVTLNTPGKEVIIKSGNDKKALLNIEGEKGKDIAVKLFVRHLGVNDSLSFYINGRDEPMEWQDSTEYIFKTLNGTAYAKIEFINPEMDTSSLTVSYYQLENGEFQSFEDEMAYLNTVIINRKGKYINHPLSVLFQDFNTYDIDINAFQREIDYNEALLYKWIDFFPKTTDEILFHRIKRAYLWRIEFNQYYSVEELDSIKELYWDVEDNSNEWNIDYKKLLSGKVLKKIELNELKR